MLQLLLVLDPCVQCATLHDTGSHHILAQKTQACMLHRYPEVNMQQQPALLTTVLMSVSLSSEERAG